MPYMPHDLEIDQTSDDDSFGSDFDSAAEEDWPADRKEVDAGQSRLPDAPQRSNSLTLEEQPQRISSSSGPPMCVVCQAAPPYSVGANVRPTCGFDCSSKLQVATGLPSPNNNHPRTSGRALTYSSPSSGLWSSITSWPSEPTTYASHTRFQSRPYQLKMCDVCHVRPRCQRGGRIYPTCGLSCAAKMHAPGSIEMCDYCKKRPKVVINGKVYPQCGKTCRDKAKLSETAANAAACTSCILCWKSTKAGPSDFCSQACEGLASARAPFLIEIPRGHVAFKKVAERFASGWQKSNTHCPTVKRVYMVVMKPSFKTSHEKYHTKLGSNDIFQRNNRPKERWLAISRECGFGDPGDVEPCSSNRCLLCCIVRSAFSRFDFPEGITTSGLNRAVECYRGGKKSSSKVAALLHVLLGREAEMSPQEMQFKVLPPQGSDSVHIVGVRNDGSKVDKGDIVVYDGDAVKPLYLISYE